MQKLREKIDKETSGVDNPRLILNVRVTGDRYLLKDSVQVEDVIR